MSLQSVKVRCCIAGGGPAGMMLGYPAGAGRRRCRSSWRSTPISCATSAATPIHPSTLEVMHELGLLDDFLKLPHQKVRKLSGQIGDEQVTVADFTHLPTHCRFIALMPQWDFLNFLAEQGAALSGLPAADAGAGHRTSIDEGGASRRRACDDAGRAARVRAPIWSSAPTGATRRCASGPDCAVQDIGAPIDVLWMRLSRQPDDPDRTVGRFDAGRIFVMIDRGDYWQCGFVIPKGAFDDDPSPRARRLPRRDRRPSPRSSATASANCTAGTTSSC